MRNVHYLVCFLAMTASIGCKKDDAVAVLSNPSEGQIVVSTYNTPLKNPAKLMILDKNGKTIWEKTTPVAAINFTKWQVNGKTRYTYMEFDTSVAQISQGILPTTAVVLNENYQEIKRVRLMPQNGRLASDPSSVDAHDFIYLDDNHFITVAYFQKVVNNIPASLNPVSNCKVVAPIIQEIVNDQVTWEWDGSNYPELYQSSVEGNAFNNASVVHDYAHINSVFIDPTDNNLICSMRNLNQVIKINRTSGNIMWRLGGKNSDFPMTPEMKFLRQHNATLTDNNQTLLLVDNGEAAERKSSRIVEFQLSPETRTIKSFNAYYFTPTIFAQYMGSVQKRGDTYFIGCGSVPKIFEVNYKTSKISFMMTLPDNSYRAFKN